MVEGEKRMRISRKTAITICVILAAVGCYLLVSNLLLTDEARIRRVIYQGKAAVEKKDIEGVMSQVSREYQDDYGLNKVAIMMIFQRVFKEFDSIAIKIEEMRIEINEKNQGQAFLLTWATVSDQDKTRYLVGSPEEPHQVTFLLAKEGGTWRVIKAAGVDPEEIAP
jgi:ketosteroid isomerase-like protein